VPAPANAPYGYLHAPDVQNLTLSHLFDLLACILNSARKEWGERACSSVCGASSSWDVRIQLAWGQPMGDCVVNIRGRQPAATART
jgi:hypothetical protein